MSSRKSSRRSSVRKSNNNQGIDMDNIQKEIDKNIAKQPNTSIGSRIPSFIFTLALYGAILYYLYNLEDADCNCIRDWRHNFIKAMCLVIIFLTFIGLFGFNLKSNSFKWLVIIYFILLIIDIYAFFTYIRDLNITKCSCAINKQPNLNSIMNIIRWIFPIIIGLFLLVIIAFIILGYSFIKHI